MDPVRVVEAVLYSSTKPISVSEIATATQLPPSQVRKALKTLVAEYDERKSAIEIVKIRSRYSMQLRKEYHDYATPFAERELPDSVLRVAAMIAYHQPVLQSDLAKMLGADVYEGVKTLRSMGLVAARKKGQTLELRTTRRFLEYFGIAGSTQEDIRKWMESQVNKSGQE
ncbi:MAG: SMC-Scp complex subunit ScpB [Methanomassiliicoccales archaeon]|nr:SMC-Scp complex subunit ScpB [Methanomassiliicoccales archaeon]